jgi:hypothetical protein
MSWQKVTVVEPPAIESLTAEVTPPAYVGDDTPVIVPVTDRTCIREGSRVQLITQVTKPVRQATLLLGGNEYEGQVDEQGRRIVFPIGLLDTSTMANRACSLGFVLEDQYGLEVKIDRSQQLELIENRPPSVTILRPTNGERVVASSVVSVDAQVEDDLGVRSVVMHWTIEGAAGVRSFVEPIYEGPEKLSFEKDASQSGTEACPAKGQKFIAKRRWDLWPLKLRIDDRLSLYVVATDYSDIRTASEPVEIMVVDSATFVNRLVSEQRAITDEMAQTLAISRRNLRRMIQVHDQLEKSGEVQVATLDLLRAVMLDRRQVVRTLTDENDGLIARSSSILNQLHHSRLRVTSLRRRLVRLVRNLEQLRTDILPQIGQNATQATKNVEQAVDPESRIAIEMNEILSPLALAIHGQERLIGRLKAMLGRLDDVVDYQRFYNELKRLVQLQGELIEETKTLGRSLLGRVAADLRSSERTRLDQTARRQSLLARESGQVVTRMVEAADRVADVDGNRLSQTVASPTARSLGATLTRAAEAIAQNQLGRAVKLQNESLAELESMLKQMTQVTDTTTTDPNAQQVNIDKNPDPNETGQQEPGQNPNDSSGEDPSGPAGNQTVQKTTFDSEGKPIRSTHLKPKAVDNLIERLWGELPDRDHQRILQLPGERFLPGYERQIEEYYKRLLEQ